WPVRPSTARSDRRRLSLTGCGSGGSVSPQKTRPVQQISGAGQTGLRPTVRPQVTFQLNRLLVKRRYLLTRVSEFGVLGLYGKILQRAIQPMNNPSKKHNFS
ncbi:Os06g0629362, partial [Oryza sativa Japonica Group]